MLFIYKLKRIAFIFLLCNQKCFICRQNSKMIKVIRNCVRKNLSISNLSSFGVRHQSVLPQLNRTHYCGSIDLNHAGQSVTLYGWLQRTRTKNFIILRDIKGIVQVYLEDQFLVANSIQIDKLNEESVLAIQGVVRKRPEGQANLKIKTGQIEVKCEKLEVLNEANSKLPFTITELNRPNETVRLKYRYLDLRFEDMQKNLIMRSDFVHNVRKFMHENNFLDIETPTLFRRTPGGAREFIVPTNRAEQFYCLTQSPQQFKQLLMVAGFDRYYQVARCYRDESSKPDRQPEFTQIDIEMSFVNENDIMKMIESLLHKCWPFEPIQVPFERMKYNDAMHLYGCDKPDIRFDMKFKDLTHLFNSSNKIRTGISKIDTQLEQSSEFVHVNAFKIPLEYGSEFLTANAIEKEYKTIFKETSFPLIDESTKSSFVFLVFNNETGNQIAKYMNEECRQLFGKEMDLKPKEFCVMMFSKHKMKQLEIFGKLRLALADRLDEKLVSNKPGANLLRDKKKFSFLWIVDFPLFTRNEETNLLESTHHPFTAPIKEHLEKLKNKQDLEHITGLHYDLVLNGSEIAGGSIRIENSDLQRHVLSNILNENTEQLEHLLKALEYGAPPHGGIAFGLDRLIAIMCGTQNIKNVIAFPKAQSGRDLMSSAPSKVPKEELDYYCIQPTKHSE
jgi:aspartyl-tRNA synthetase